MNKDKIALIGQAASGLAHEVRNPLMAITGLVKILKDKIACKEELGEIMDTLDREAGELKILLNRLLNIAQPPPPKLKLECLEHILYEVIADLVRDPGLNHNRCVSYTINRDDNFPKWIYVDHHQLKQVIACIASNAVESITGKGKVTFSMRNYIFDNGVRLEIADNGCGIPRKNLYKVGLPFFTTKAEGKGLDLSASFMIIDRHGGRLEIDSVEGKGTVVSVYLPI